MRTTAKRLRIITFCLLQLLAFGVGQAAKATQYTVEMTSDWKFSPAYLEIQVGDVVTWVNHDWSYYMHDSVCPGYWNSGLLDVDESASLQFPITGTFNYRDSSFYLFGMKGTIVVNPSIQVQPTPAILIAPQPMQGGGFQFTLSNLVVGTTYVIQASTNLVNWSNIATSTASSPVESFADAEAAADDRRFYRSWHLP
jgi:plastocyanin